MTTGRIDPDALHTLLGSNREHALLDVRELRRTHDDGAILLGVSTPLSVLEERVPRLVPRRGTTIVVYDGGGGDDAARIAARRLTAGGYSDVRVLDGGVAGWVAAGHRSHLGGDHIVGQSFGELVEADYGTPHISVLELTERRARGEDIVVLDSRPLPEFEGHSIPGAVSIPGAELVHRAGEVVTGPDTLVVVHCAGRTRSIVGAQTLINAGLPNRVVALAGGTQSWTLEGLELEHGERRSVGAPSATSRAQALAAADRMRTRFAVREVTPDVVDTWREEPDRTTYLLDVRTPEEYAAGHVTGAVSAPSWDVVPWIFRHVGTRGSRVVLVDDDGVRATVTASWLDQMGWAEIVISPGLHARGPLTTDVVRPEPIGIEPGRVRPVRTDELGGLPGAVVIDLRTSTSYRAGHVPGATWVSATRLGGDGDALPPALASGRPLVLVSDTGSLAQVAASRLDPALDVRVLDGGHAAWQEASLPVETTEHRFLHEPEDTMRSGWYETDLERRKEGFRRYLAWEATLVEELAQDDTVSFRTRG